MGRDLLTVQNQTTPQVTRESGHISYSLGSIWLQMTEETVGLCYTVLACVLLSCEIVVIYADSGGVVDHPLYDE